MRDLIVVGGGVAGLMAAGLVAGKGQNVLLLEKMEKTGRKLRITGKGRCNLTNVRPIDEFLAKIPQGADFVRGSIEEFDNKAVVDFFESIGVPLTTERGGRVFPTSGRAWDIAQAMVEWARAQGVEIWCNATVESVGQTDIGFEVGLNDGRKFPTRKLLITTGGASYPATGSTGDGYQFGYDLGHTVVPLRPSLVPLEIENFAQYRGLALKNVGLRLIVDGLEVAERFGDVEFTDRAFGGAIVLQISRIAVDAILDKKRVEVELDMKPALSAQKLRGRIERETQAMPTATFKTLLQKLVPSNLFQKIAEQSGVKLSQPIINFSAEEIEQIISALKSLRFKIIDYRPFTEAIITAGGIELSEIDPTTMQSLIVPNLYFAGEVLDIDADTGGFNIQVALSTAHTAARSI